MEYYLLYMLFAVATSLTAMYELVHPVIRKQIAEKKLVGEKVPSLVVIYVTFLLINTLFAPLVFFSCIIPSWGERFRSTLQVSLFADD